MSNNQTTQPALVIHVPKLDDVIAPTMTFLVLCISLIIKNKILPKLGKLSKLNEFTNRQDDQIFAILNQILAITNADRVIFSLLHNGDKTNVNYTFRKISITHEALEQGVSPAAYTVQSLPISLIAKDLDRLKDRKNFSEITLEKLQEPISKQHFIISGVKKAYCKFVGKSGTPIGILAIHYCSKEVPTNLDLSRCEQLLDLLIAIIDTDSKSIFSLLVEKVLPDKNN